MLANAIVRTKITSLKEEKAAIGLKKLALMKENAGIRDYLRLTGRLADDDPIVLRKKEINTELEKLEVRIHEIRKELEPLFRKDDANHWKVLIGILKEIFNDQQLQEIYDESDNRLAGGDPQRILFNLDAAQSMYEEADRWKKLYVAELEKSQEVRIILNRVIEEGCKKFGDAEFLKIISPLNRFVLPLNELKKLKRTVFPRDYITK